MIALLTILSCIFAFVSIALHVPQTYAEANESGLYVQIAILCVLSATIGGTAWGFIVYNAMRRLVDRSLRTNRILFECLKTDHHDED